MRHKIIIIGDTHLGRFGSNITLFERFIYKVVFPLCDKDTVLVFTGDQFDNNRSIDIMLLSKVIDVFNKISEKVHSCHFLVGNHDLWKLQEIGDNATKVFSVWKNFHVHINSNVEINGTNFHFMSYNHDEDLIVKQIKESKGGICVSHQDILEFYGAEHKPIMKGLSISEFDKYDLVFNGHIHRKNTIKNTHNVGTPYQLNFGECGNLCGLHILDTDTNDVAFVENTNYPRHHKLEYEDVVSDSFSGAKYEKANIWVVNSKDDDAVAAIMEKTDCLSYKTATLNVENDVEEDFDFEHYEDVTDNTRAYLESIDEMPIKGKIVEVTPELVDELMLMVNKL